jgi:hypothetical protein
MRPGYSIVTGGDSRHTEVKTASKAGRGAAPSAGTSFSAVFKGFAARFPPLHNDYLFSSRRNLVRMSANHRPERNPSTGTKRQILSISRLT